MSHLFDFFYSIVYLIDFFPPDFEPSGNSRIYSWPSTLATDFLFFFIAVTDVILISSTRNKKRNTLGKILRRFFLYLFPVTKIVAVGITALNNKIKK